jgi:hypothetical protein
MTELNTTCELVHTTIGNYKLEDAVHLDDLKTVEDIKFAGQ